MTSVTKSGQHPARAGSADYFIGTVRIEELATASAPARQRVRRVSLTPGSRTAWHTHPLGQSLYALEGVGRVQREGGPLIELRPGDSVWIPPDEKHWHGAAPDHAFTHLAIHEANERGVDVVWLEQVSDEDYRARPAG